MKTALKRLCAVLLTLALTGLCLLPASAAVPMPAGFTEAQVEASIPKAESLVEALLKSGAVPDPAAAVYGALYSDAAVNALFSGIYGAFLENESTLSALGVDLSVASVAEALRGFPNVYQALSGKTDWNSVLQLVPTLRWEIRDRTAFGAAAAGLLSPLNPLLFTLLCGGSYQISPLISVAGADGYRNAIVPLLRSLGCPAVIPQAEYTSMARHNYFSMVRNLVDMLFSALDAILAAPVTSLCDLLPGVAYYLENGGLTQTLKTLMEPLTVRVAVFSLPGVSRLLENSEAFSSGVDLKALMEKADLGALTGGNAKLKLPEIDLPALAACGSVQNGTYVPNRAQAFVVLMTWVLDAVRLNGAALPAGAEALSSFLNKSSAELLTLLLKLLNLSPVSYSLTPSWSAPVYTPGAAEFPAELTRENCERMLGMIDDTLNELLTEFSDKGSLSDVLRKTVYSNKTVSTLVKTVYSALGSEDAAPLLSLLGVDASPAGLAAALRRNYPAAARTLSGAASWAKVYPAGLSWGFADGSRDGFTAAVTAALLPFAPMLRYLLAGGSLTVMDTLTLGGANGYETAVVPLLEGLGCAPDTVVSYAAYRQSSDAALVSSILRPVTALLDSVCEKPVDTLCGLLPQLAFFLQSDQMKQCMTHLLYPVTQTLSSLGLQSLLPAELTSPSLPDPAALLTGLTADSLPDLKLPAPDLSKVAALGTAQARPSKRAGGAQYTFIEADKPAVLLTVLRYVIGAVKSGDSAQLLSKISLGGGKTAEAGPDMMSVYTEKTMETLKGMTVDETIVWLYDLLFSETPQRETPADEGYIPTVIYEEAPDHTARNRTVISVAALALLTGLVIFLAKFDFHKAGERRRRRKDLRREKKPAAVKKTRPQRGSIYDTTQPQHGGRYDTTRPQRSSIYDTTRPPTEAELRRAYRATKRADRRYGKTNRT